MRPVFLIAGNFVREQRWVVAAWVTMAFGFAGLVAGIEGKPDAEDVETYFSQQAVYAVGLGVFLAVSAIHNERKSRRILAVLSKAVTRRQYVAGLLAGVFACCGAHCLSLGLARNWIAVQTELPSEQVWIKTGLVFAAAILAASVAMFWSTFSHPLGAVIGASVLMGTPPAVAQRLGEGWSQALPAYWLASLAVAPRQVGWEAIPWAVLALAAAEVFAFWMAASWIFSRRDVTAAVE
jgi:ABC-type transport system involved in multi-copper enzyme maturation permease subunit